MTAMAHLICVGHSRAEMRDILKNYHDAGVVNVMALGGDIPDDAVARRRRSSTHAIDLVELAREVGDFSIGVAAHPQGHPRSQRPRVATGVYLAEKLELADFAVTQFFFELEEWTRLVEELARTRRRPSRCCRASCRSPRSRASSAWRAMGARGATRRSSSGSSAARRARRTGRGPGRGHPAPPSSSCRRACSTPTRPVCTSTRSIGRPPRARSTRAFLVVVARADGDFGPERGPLNSS